MRNATLILLSSILLFSCIGDDIVFDTVEPTLRINTTIDTLAINSSFQFEYQYLNNIGVEEEIAVQWESSDPSIVQINPEGIAEGLDVGAATISATATTENGVLIDRRDIVVGASTVISSSTERSGEIRTTTFYTLEGDFVLRQNGANAILDIAENYRASSSLPGLYVYLTNNPNTTANAIEISAVDIFAGAHSFDIPNVDINDYEYVLYFCKPFNVKVGDGQIN